MMVLGERSPYISFCLLLVWQVLQDLVIDKGGGHIMDNEENNDAEWAVGEDGGGGNHEINFWANVH